MKNLKRITLLFLAITILLSCAKEYDDSELRGRIENLETWQKTVNSQIVALQGLVNALESRDQVTSVTELADNSGYAITFSKSSPITIRHGRGGADAVAPVIGVKQDADGKYYWTLDGEYISDGGHKIPATGDKGEAGSNGATPHVGADGNWWIGTTDTGVKAAGSNGNDGATPHVGPDGNWWIGTTDTGVKAQGEAGSDAVAPQVRIDAITNVWEISIDGGTIWTSTGVKATGDSGAQGDAVFAKDGVDISDPDNVTFTLADGAIITLPRTSSVTVGFESYEIVDAIAGMGCPGIHVVMPAAETYTSIMAKIECNGGTSVDIKTRVSGSAWGAEIIKGAGNKVSIKVTPAVGVQDGDVAVLTVSIVTRTGAMVSASRTIKVTAPTPITPAGNTYTIASASQLSWVMDQMSVTDFTKGKTFELETDLDLTGYSCKPIGAQDDGVNIQFVGTFDGKGHTIKGLDIKRDLNHHVGFFSFVGETGIVKNLNVEGTVVNSMYSMDHTKTISTGGIAGANIGAVINCSFKGNVSSNNIFHTGGIVGVNQEGLVAGCSYIGSEGAMVRANGREAGTTAYSGGVVGYNAAFTANAYVLGCSNTGRVSAVSRCGGIVGENFGTASVSVGAIIVGCYNHGYIKSDDGAVEVGGIAGAIGDYSEIWGCYNAGSVSSDDASNEDVCAIMGRDVFWEASDKLNTNYWLTGSAPKGYSNVRDDQVVDCVGKSEVEMNSAETIGALNAAIDVWNAANGNLCGYKFAAGDRYPKLIQVD